MLFTAPWRHIRWVSLAAVAATLALTTLPASAAAGWTVVSIPATGTNTQLNGVFARTGTDAWAVGEQYSSPIGPVVYHWNGSSWSADTDPTAGTYSPLYGASTFPGASSEWAAGINSSDTGLVLSHG